MQRRIRVSTSALDLASAPQRARDGLTVVNVIEVLVRIMGIVDDERAAQAVAVLRGYVAVVPERACVDVRPWSVTECSVFRCVRGSQCLDVEHAPVWPAAWKS